MFLFLLRKRIYMCNFALMLVIFTGFCSLSLSAQEEGLLLYSSFNRYTTTADFQSNPEDIVTGIPRELQLRMHPDLDDRQPGKNNSVCLNNQEYIGYPAYKNFNPARGSVSLWVKPINWQMNDIKYNQVFFEARFTGYRLLIQKQPAANIITLYLKSKNKKYHINGRAEDWLPGQWHNLVATWDRNGMQLYIDGKNSQLNFTEDPELPKESRWGEIWLNAIRDWIVNPEWKTAYDEFKVYDRVLTATEVLANYEKIFPSTALPSNPIVTVPLSDCPVVCDGIVDAAEWNDASQVPIVSPMPANRHNKDYFASVKLKHDEQNLYLAFMVPEPARKYDITSRDGEPWFNDLVEFHVIGTDQVQRQFAVNPAGAFYDSLNGDKKWNSDGKSAASRNKDNWTAELVIPWSDLGGKGELLANFCTSSSEAQNLNFTWSAVSGLANGFKAKQFFGRLKLGLAKDAVAIKSLGSLQAGKLQVAIGLAPAAAVDLKLSNMDGSNINAKIDAGGIWQQSLPSGISKLELRCGEAFFYPLTFPVNPPLTVNATAYPGEKRLVVRLDYRAAKLAEKEQKGKVSLLEKNSGKVWASKEFMDKASEQQVELPLLPELPDNTAYIIKAELFTEPPLKVEKDFFIPDMTPYEKRIAMDHTVPSPWKPLQVQGNSISMLDREYIFTAGPLPAQIISRGDSLLQSQPQFELNGIPLSWEKTKIGVNHGDYVEVSADGSFAGGRVTAAGELWFDGMYKWTLSLEPQASIMLNRLVLQWSMPSQFARYVLSPAYTPWKNDQVLLNWDTREYHSLLWLCGIETGLAWWCQSDANWVLDPNQPNIIIHRDGKTVNVNINIMARPAELMKKATYTMVFQGTPPRPVNTAQREWTWGKPWLPVKPDICFYENGHGGSGVKDASNMQDWTSMIPVDKTAFREKICRLLSENMKSIVYGMPTHLTRLDAEYDYFFKTWSMHPAVTWEAQTATGEKYLTEPCCAHTGAGDLFAYRIDKLLQEQPELFGIYFDVMHVKNCDNPLHGCGGIDSFGKKYSTSGALNLREYCLRVYKLANKYGRIFLVHAHNAFFPFVHDLSNGWNPGEEMFTAVHDNPEWAYLEAIAPEAWQSAWNCNLRGVEIRLMSQLERVPQCLGWGKNQAESLRMRSFENALHALAPSVLYDFQVTTFATEPPGHPIFKYWKIRKDIGLAKAKFHGYWYSDAVASRSANVKASWYEWEHPAPYRRLIGVVNTGRETQKAGLLIDWHKLGLPEEPGSLKELWQDKLFNPKEISEIEIPGHNFLLLGIE